MRLRRARAEIVALADIDTLGPQDVVGRGAVELHLEHREMIEVVLCRHRLRLAADRDGDACIILAVDLIGPEPLQEVDGLVDARLHPGPGGLLVGQARQIDAGDAAGAKRVIADLAHLALQGEHVGV